MTSLAIDKQIDFHFQGNFREPSAYVVSWDKSLIGQYIPRSSSIVSNVGSVLDFLYSRDILIENTIEVENFLTEKVGVVNYLYEAPEKISQYFGKSIIKLAIFNDPDDDNKQDIYFEIETDFSPEEANERLSKLNREWIFSSSDVDLMSINVTLKFI